jgi:hypothetical protein
MDVEMKPVKKSVPSKFPTAAPKGPDPDAPPC